MTNGEKIQQMFPNAEIGYGLRGVVAVTFIHKTIFDLDWWNAEYKEPIKQEPNWISVYESLPEIDGDYLVIEKSGRVCTYVFHKKGNSKEYWKRCAVAWMPKNI